MVYIDYLDNDNAFVCQLEGDNWTLKSFKVKPATTSKTSNSYKCEIINKPITIEIITDANDKAIFDIDIGIKMIKCDFTTETEYLYKHFFISGKNETTILLRENYGRYDKCNLAAWISDHTKHIRDYFKKIDEINQKKEQLNGDFHE